MKSSLKSGAIGFAIGLAVAAAGAQAAVQATQHQHSSPPVHKPAADAMTGMGRMKDMHTMMADLAMRQKMITNIAQCRDIMAMMMEHMRQDGMKAPPAPHKQ